MFDNKGLAWLHRERLKLPNNTNDVALFVALFFQEMGASDACRSSVIYFFLCFLFLLFFSVTIKGENA